MEKYIIKKVINKKDINVEVPGSKSITNRALMLAAISNGKCKISGVLFSDDSRAFLDCLDKVGFKLEIDENAKTVVIQGENGKIPNHEATINVRSAGTAARFMTVLLAVCGGKYTLESSEQMKKRPMSELLDKLMENGVEIEYLEKEGHFPFKLNSKGIGETKISIDTSKSSQYASALLMAAAVNGMEVNLTGSRPNGAYIKITLRMLEQFGIKFKKNNNTYNIKKQEVSLDSYAIEPDMSAACYFYAMAILLKVKSAVKGIHLNSMQGDIKFLTVLEKLGCKLTDTPAGVEVDGTGIDSYPGIEIDMSDFSDQALTMAVVAAFANSKTIIKNIGHIRGQESDRVSVIATELRKLGCKTEIIEGTKTDVVIEPGVLHGCEIDTYEDHRVAMSFAMAGLIIDDVIIDKPMCCRKTFENYFDVLESIY